MCYAGAGHIHAYERTFPLNNYAVDQCGPRYLTMGDGGNIEGLYKTFAAQAGTCTCAAVNSATTSNGCPCQAVIPSTIPSVRRCPGAAVHALGALAPVRLTAMLLAPTPCDAC